MKRKLNDGSEMPVVGLGTWKSKASDVEDAVFNAICTAGYRHIDAAQIYMNQEQVGNAIRSAMDACGVQRGDLWVTSKVWMTDYHPDDIPAAVDRILRELQLDYVDQLLLHWPIPYAKPPGGCPPACPEKFAGTDDAMRPRGADGLIVTGDIPLVDTWLAMEGAKASGKVRSIGVSNFGTDEIVSLAGGRKDATVPAVNQVEAHVFWNQAHLRRDMQALGVAVVAYTPLGNPAIYGDKMQGMTSKLVTEIAADAGLTPAQVMLNFLIAQDVIVVPKSVTPSRIADNINFLLNLTREHIDRLIREAPQNRLANPKNRPGGRPVFVDDVAPMGQRNEL